MTDDITEDRQVVGALVNEDGSFRLVSHETDPKVRRAWIMRNKAARMRSTGERLTWQSIDSKPPAGPAITPELTAAALRHWFGDRGKAEQASITSRSGSDGGSYTLTGTVISDGGQWGVLYLSASGELDVEFYDGAGGTITDNGDGSWTFHAYGNHTVICPADTASSLECRTGLCTHGAKRD